MTLLCANLRRRRVPWPLHVIVYPCPICRLPLHITVARRRSRCLSRMIGGRCFILCSSVQHVSVSASLRYHQSVNALFPALRSPLFFPLFFLSSVFFLVLRPPYSSSSRTIWTFAFVPGNPPLLTECKAAGPLSPGWHGHKDRVHGILLDEATISPSPHSSLCRACIVPVRLGWGVLR